MIGPADWPVRDLSDLIVSGFNARDNVPDGRCFEDDAVETSGIVTGCMYEVHTSMY